MNVLTRWLSRWRGLPLMTAVLAIVVPAIFVVRGTASGDGSTSVVQLVVAGVLLGLLVVVVVRLGVMLAGVDPDAGAIAAGLASAPDQQRLLARWLTRTRWARNVGGLAGLTWWVLGTSMQGDAFLYGVGGIAVGSMVAQLHHVRRPRGARTASLDRRSVVAYIPDGWRTRMIAVAVGSLVLVIGGLTLDDSGNAAWWGLVALAVLAAAHLVQRRVASRPRPALATGLQQADDLARGLAIDRGLAQPATYSALALIAHGSAQLEPSLGMVAVIISVGAWLYALYSWWHNRRLGLDPGMSRRQPVPAAA